LFVVFLYQTDGLDFPRFCGVRILELAVSEQPSGGGASGEGCAEQIIHAPDGFVAKLFPSYTRDQYRPADGETCERQRALFTITALPCEPTRRQAIRFVSVSMAALR
jgi:hypothetical protein